MIINIAKILNTVWFKKWIQKYVQIYTIAKGDLSQVYKARTKKKKKPFTLSHQQAEK